MINSALVAGAVLAAVANAHEALWHPAAFGFDYPEQNKWPYANEGEKGNYGSGDLMAPLRQMDNLGVDKWFAHGMLDHPPPKDVFLNVESGGTLNVEISPNRAFTRWGYPKDIERNGARKMANEEAGPMHTVQDFDAPVNISLFGGSALAISYNSDVKTAKPEDFTVISTQWLSVWWRVGKYAIPTGLPPCPPEGCLCTWNWIHTAGNRRANHRQGFPEFEGYGSEIYNNLLRCKVTGQTNENNVVPKGAVPTECVDDTKNCTSGPKQPLYIYQANGNNVGPDTLHGPPSYNWRWGFPNGAQQDAVVAKGQEATANGKGGEGLDPASVDLSEPDFQFNLNATVIVGNELYGGGKINQGTAPANSTDTPAASPTDKADPKGSTTDDKASADSKTPADPKATPADPKATPADSKATPADSKSSSGTSEAGTSTSKAADPKATPNKDAPKALLGGDAGGEDVNGGKKKCNNKHRRRSRL